MTRFFNIMCTNPFTIFNNRRFVSSNYLDVFKRVPCGSCVCCQQQKQTEWALRSYYEFREVMDSVGFVYWDTLTYDNYHIPTYYGQYCFSRKDVQDFFKRLRIELFRQYGLENSVLRYLVTSEYGEERHRVHYHVVYFVHTDKLDCYKFQRLLSECWTLGECGNDQQIRDGKKTDYSEFIINSQKALSYVCKYIAKDDEFTRSNTERVIASVVSNNVFPIKPFVLHHDYNKHFSFVTLNLDLTPKGRIKKVKFPNLARISEDDLYSYSRHITEDGEVIYHPLLNERLIKRYFQPFHLQSVGFGSYLLTHPDLDKDAELAFMPTNTNPKKPIPLPLYYRRKLFYHTVDLYGRISWYPNDDYKDKLLDKELKAIDNDVLQLTNRIRSVDALLNIPSIYDNVALPDSFVAAVDEQLSNSTYCSRILRILGNRSIRDLAIYQRYYRYRVSRDDEDVQTIISRRLYDVQDEILLGKYLNPLQVENADERLANRRFFRSCVKSVKSFAFDGFDAILDLLDAVFTSYSSFAVLRDLSDRRQRKKYKTIKNSIL